MDYLLHKTQFSVEAAVLLQTAGTRLNIGHALMAASPYIVVGIIVLITLIILWRQIRQLKSGGGSCCSRPDKDSTNHRSTSAQASNNDNTLSNGGDLPGCNGCSYAGRCQPKQSPVRQKGIKK